MVSDTPTEGRCNAEIKGGYCEGWPTKDEHGEVINGRCWNHGGVVGDNHGAPKGNQNGVKHGAFKEHFRNDLTDSEQEAIDDLVEHLDSIEGPRAIAAESAAEALMKYKRSADSRFLREARQWFGDFNLIPNGDSVDVTSGGESLSELLSQ